MTKLAFPFDTSDRSMDGTSSAFLQDYTSLYSDSATQGSSAYNTNNLKKMTIAVSATGKHLCATADCSDYTGYQKYGVTGIECRAWPNNLYFGTLKFFS